MTQQTFTLDDLTRILREAAGESDSADLGDDDIGDMAFDLLGYDSVALLETGSRIERELGLRMEDTALADAQTPNSLVKIVNQELGATPRD